MKLTMEIQGHQSGQSDSKRNPGEKVDWSSLWGSDSNNRYARAVVYGKTAKALNASIKAKLSENEVVSAKRMVITLDGEWRTNDSGKRTFWADTFDILDGMALESARLRKDATDALAQAEKLRMAGQLSLAYEAVAAFTANFAGQPLDLTAFLADAESHDAEFGSVATEADPEALAAAHFARVDNASTKEDKQEEIAETKPEDATDFGGDDPVLGAVETDGEIPEEEEMELVAEGDAGADVLDDAPVSDKPEKKVTSAGKTTFAPPGMFKPTSAGSKPFTKPDMPKQETSASVAKAPDEKKPKQAEQKLAVAKSPMTKPPFLKASSSPFGGGKFR